MNELIMIGTQLTGNKQVFAKWLLIGIVILWAALVIINKVKGNKE